MQIKFAWCFCFDYQSFSHTLTQSEGMTLLAFLSKHLFHLVVNIFAGVAQFFIQHFVRG